MRFTMIIAAAASLTSLTAVAAPAFADNLKPLEAASFNVGSEHAIGYFTSDNGRCHLAVTRAGEPNWDQNGSLTVTLFESSISAGQSTHYERTVDFTCASDAQSMQINKHSQLTDAQ